jgi:hypothetical protein
MEEFPTMHKKPCFSIYTRAADRQVLFRNCSCPEYDDCLSTAAVHDLLLECTYCPNCDETVVEFRPDFFEIKGCAALLHAIFLAR